jgi:uncharacterized protein HemX
MSESKQASQPAGWYEQLPRAARLYIQGGFALVVAVVFVALVGVLVVLVQGMQHTIADQAREDRATYRETTKEMAARQERTERLLLEAVLEMRRAIDRLDAGQRQLRSEVKVLKESGSGGFKAPDPRQKPDDPE